MIMVGIETLTKGLLRLFYSTDWLPNNDDSSLLRYKIDH
jgi:hypothetical protein